MPHSRPDAVSPPVSPPSSAPDRPAAPVISWDDIRIASPCDRNWDAMSGDDRCRFCSDCRKNVFDLTEMSRASAESLVHEHEGRLCVRLYRRKDGRLVTGDCVKSRRHVGRIRKVVAAGAAVMLTFGSVAVAGSVISGVTPERELAAHGTFARRVQDTILDLRVSLGIDPEPEPVIMGEIQVFDPSLGSGNGTPPRSGG